jgi:hypothetical protein
MARASNSGVSNAATRFQVLLLTCACGSLGVACGSVSDEYGDVPLASAQIRQLEGAALAACVTRLDCAECEPGWCATEVPQLVPQQNCETGRYYPPFRFVLGAAQARSAQVTIVCNEAPD